MNAEYDDLIASFLAPEALEDAIEQTIRQRLETGFSQPLSSSLPPQWGGNAGAAVMGGEDDGPEQRVRKVASRIVVSRRAA